MWPARDSGKKDVNTLRKAYRDSPYDPRIAVEFARALEACGESSESISVLTQLINGNRADEDAFLLAAGTLKNRGELEEALRVLRKAQETFSSSVVVRYSIGQVLGLLGRTEEALSEQKAAIELDPGNAEAHFRLGVTYSNANRYEEALKEYETAIDLNPLHARATQTWVLCWTSSAITTMR